MKYHIENDFFKVEVEETGAELRSILSKKTNREYIWQPNEDIWGSSSPVLFPVIGHLKDGVYSYKGSHYKLPKHGLIRNNDRVKLINRTATRLSFVLSSDEDTLKQYPFEFNFKINFFLMENKLQIFHEIINTGTEDLLFSLGGHPAFNIPWKKGEDYLDYYIQFENKENASVFDLRPSGLLGKKETMFLNNTNRLNLSHELFEKDAKIFTQLSSNEVTLKSKSNRSRISVNFDDFPFLGIWAKPNGNFVCIEPWDGLPDYEESTGEFTKKKGNLKLTPGNIHYASYTIQIDEK